jgi:glycosyltransferase involved in cell wall biosynthesis
MQEQRFSAKIRVLLIGDTHPEMIAIAKKLAQKGFDFKIVLPTYFTFPESVIINRIGFGITSLKPWLQKRTLDSSISSKTILRPFAFLETLTWLFKKLGYYRISWKFAQQYNRRITKKIPRLIELFHPDIVVSYDTIKFPRSEEYKHIVICPMSHPAAVERSLIQSKVLFPNWPEMEDEKPLGVNDTAFFADRIVLLSQFAKDTYAAEGYEKSKLEVIHIGPINKNENPQPLIDYRSSVLRILFLGRMTRVKGVEALARLSHLLNPMDFQISLVGQCSPVIATYIREISNAKVLTLIDNPQPSDISKYFAESDIFALPSFNEGFNISSLEAMSYGLIPILSKNSGVSEILRNTELSDFIINPGSIQDLEKRLKYLSNMHHDEFIRLANVSFDLSKKFSFDRFAEDFVSVLTKELNK